MKEEEIKHNEDIPEVEFGDKIEYLPHFLYDIKETDWKIGELLGYEDSYGCRLEFGEHSHVKIKDENGNEEEKCEHEIKHIKYYIISKMMGDVGRKIYGEKIYKTKEEIK